MRGRVKYISSQEENSINRLVTYLYNFYILVDYATHIAENSYLQLQ